MKNLYSQYEGLYEIQLYPAIAHFKGGLVKIMLSTEVFIIANMKITQNASIDENMYTLKAGLC